MREKTKPTYIMVSRRLINTWLASSTVILILIIASFQYTNYVDRKSNHQWCNLINLFNESYKELPPPTELGKKIAREMETLSHSRSFSCTEK